MKFLVASIVIMAVGLNYGQQPVNADFMDRFKTMFRGLPIGFPVGERHDLIEMATNRSESDEELFDCSTQELIEKAGFVSRTHQVTTSDGYITELINIINPLANQDLLKQPPVLFFHGALLDPSSWISGSVRQHHPEKYPRKYSEDGPMTSSNRSLALLLANHGFDVWLAGTRGCNKQNLRHTQYTTELLDDMLLELNIEPTRLKVTKFLDTLKYFDFSQDQLVDIEYPKQIDEVAKLTGSERVSVVAYSKATQIMAKIMADHTIGAHTMGRALKDDPKLRSPLNPSNIQQEVQSDPTFGDPSRSWSRDDVESNIVIGGEFLYGNPYALPGHPPMGRDRVDGDLTIGEKFNPPSVGRSLGLSRAVRIHSQVAIAPILNNVGTSNFWKVMAKIAVNLPNSFGNLVFSQLIASAWTRRMLASIEPHTWFHLATNFMFGTSPRYQTSTELSMIGHFLTSESFTEAKHYCQQILAGKLQRYDHGPIMNSFLYNGNSTPPEYDLSRIRSERLMLVSGEQDTLGTPDSAQRYFDLLAVKPDKWIKLPNANHMDLVFALDNDMTVNLPVLEFMEKHKIVSAGLKQSWKLDNPSVEMTNKIDD